MENYLLRKSTALNHLIIMSLSILFKLTVANLWVLQCRIEIKPDLIIIEYTITMIIKYVVIVVYLYKLPKPAAVIIPHCLSITKRFQWRIGLHNTKLYHSNTRPIWYSQVPKQHIHYIMSCRVEPLLY